MSQPPEFETYEDWLSWWNNELSRLEGLRELLHECGQIENMKHREDAYGLGFKPPGFTQREFAAYYHRERKEIGRQIFVHQGRKLTEESWTRRSDRNAQAEQPIADSRNDTPRP